ncbi:MAG: LPP20 family lipoprotein [Elusimicrobiota bacterium]|nr:LPP20 family lipoprotein [Elusimicrobiota bacterium]
MNQNPLRLLPLLLLSLCACAGGGAKRGPSSAGGPRPAWVEGESPRWPRARFVLGVGSAEDEEAAADRARGEVARVFSSVVTVDTSADETESSLTQGGKTATTFSQTVAQQVRTVAKKALEGSDVVERWKDSATGRFYALAALPKDRALLAVTEKLQSLDGEAAAYKAKLDAAPDRFEKAKAAAKLSALLKARGELEAEHRVLGGGKAESALDAGAARSAAAAALAALSVIVGSEGDGAKEVVTGVVTGLNAAGLSAKPAAGGAAADLLADADVSVEPGSGGDERWKWSRAKAIVTLKEGREGKVFSRFEASERQASADPGEARRRALSALSKKVAAQTESAIRAFFENQ